MDARTRDSLKSGIIFAAVGVALALAAPPLLASAAAMMSFGAGGLLGAVSVSGVVASALVFGGLGMLYPRVKSLLDSASGKLPTEVSSQSIPARVGGSRQRGGEPSQASEQLLEDSLGDRANATFCQKLDADRARRNAADSLGV
jgi:hypothetical protein